MLAHTRIVLVNTSHPGNIGAAARAMKTMGLSHLILVEPKHYPHDKAIEMASGAADILANAKVVETLNEAIADCTLVIGTSSRMRAIPWPLLNPREMAEKIKHAPIENKTAILFGREQTGLTNEELQRCHLHIHIPANPAYSSLNIAAAVQVITYELKLASSTSMVEKEQWDYRKATHEEMERFYHQLKDVLIQLNFLKLSAPKQLMTRLRRLFYRAEPDVMEMNILRGILSAIQDSFKKKDDTPNGT